MWAVDWQNLFSVAISSCLSKIQYKQNKPPYLELIQLSYFSDWHLIHAMEFMVWSQHTMSYPEDIVNYLFKTVHWLLNSPFMVGKAIKCCLPNALPILCITHRNFWPRALHLQSNGSRRIFFSNNLTKGQIKPKAGLSCRRFSQKTNERICFVCCEKQKSKQNKFIHSFVFWKNLRRANLLLVLSAL